MSAMRGRKLFMVAVVAGAALGLYALVGASLSRGAILQTLMSLTVAQVAALLALSILNYALRFLRWSWYLRRLGHQIPASRHCAYYLAGFALTITPGKAGEAVRGFYLKAHGVSYADTFAALVVERLLDVLAIAALSALILLAFGEYWWLVGVSGGAVAVVTAVVTSQSTPRFLDALANHLGGRLGAGLGHISRLLRGAASLLRPDLLFIGLLIGLAAWAAEGVGLYYLLAWLGLPVSAAAGLGAYSLAVLAGALSFLPGGLGSAEAVMALLIVALGGSAALAFAATVICRAATLWFAVLIGVLAMAALEIRALQKAG